MGAVRSMLVKPIRTFNIEQRTEKILDKSKPTPAPTYASVEKQRELAKKLNPDFMENHYKKDAVLGDRLKKVFVTSTEHDDTKTESSRAMPFSREQFKVQEYGVHQPEVVPTGKCTLRDASKFLERHKADPENNPISKISATYKLDEKIVANIVKHFRILQLQTVESKYDNPFAEEPIRLSSFVKLSSKETHESQDVRKQFKKILDDDSK